jgi:cell wall-associated NlpC family hydrolase
MIRKLVFVFLFPLYLISSPVQEEIKLSNLISQKYGFSLNPQRGDNLRLFHLVLKWEGTPFQLQGRSLQGIGSVELVSEFVEQLYYQNLVGTPSSMFKKVDLRKMGEVPAQGDLVFFKDSKGNVFHVGILLKSQLFIHSHVKYGVVVESLEDPIYKNSFLAFGKLPEPRK